MLRRLDPKDVPDLRREAVSAEVLDQAGQIVSEVRSGGFEALVSRGRALGDLGPGDPVILERRALLAALEALPKVDRALLERTADRIRSFAQAQRDAISDVVHPVPGGSAGLRYVPVDRAGCYAPGGRYPLPSSVLMTAITARVAGVSEVWVASPRPAPVTLAAAALADADAVLAIGGAQAVAALAYGAAPVPAVDCIVGPGNAWVTAAKQLVAGRVTIDMLAGPSELVVLADGRADPELVAADLLAQAEHDPLALPILVSLDAAFCDSVDAALARQLSTLPTAEVARAAVKTGFAVVAGTLKEAVDLCDRLAPEHLAVHLAEQVLEEVAPRLRHYGALFLGEGAAEVLGDYGAGPNHVLPTGGTARSVGALSVMTFLRAQTWLRVDRPGELARDAADLARLEGLEAHARAADLRVTRGR